MNALKVATGLFDVGKTIDGIPFMIPKSISFAAMSQTEFEQWYDRVVEIITTRIVPNVNSDDLEYQVQEILDGNR